VIPLPLFDVAAFVSVQDFEEHEQGDRHPDQSPESLLEAEDHNHDHYGSQ
jgi:hypothetical protein